MTATPMGPVESVQGEFYLFLAAVVLAGLGFMAAIAAVQRRGSTRDPPEREQPATFVLGAGLFLLAVAVALVLQSLLAPLLEGPPAAWLVVLFAGVGLLLFWYLQRPPTGEPGSADAEQEAAADPEVPSDPADRTGNGFDEEPTANGADDDDAANG